MTEKICAHCRAKKPVTEFYRKTQKKDGYSSSCKLCEREGKHRSFKARGERYFNANMTNSIDEDPDLVGIVKLLHDNGPMKEQAIAKIFKKGIGSKLVTLSLLEDYIQYEGHTFVLAEDEKAFISLVPCGR